MSFEHPILVAGIGNIFCGDDAFGCEVIRELQRERHPWPSRVRLEDFGIRGYDLAYAIMDGADTILIDAVPRGHAPGTLYLIEPNLAHLGPGVPDGHSMSVVNVLNTIESLGGQTGRLYLVGCEPLELEPPGGEFALSAPVRAAVPQAAALVERIVADLLYHLDPLSSAPRVPSSHAALKEVS